MSTKLSESDRAAIEHTLARNLTYTNTYEAIARHFLDIGLERAAVICETVDVFYEAEKAIGRLCARAIRAAKG